MSRHDRIVTWYYKTDKDDLGEAKTGGVSRMMMHCTNQCLKVEGTTKDELPVQCVVSQDWANQEFMLVLRLDGKKYLISCVHRACAGTLQISTKRSFTHGMIQESSNDLP